MGTKMVYGPFPVSCEATPVAPSSCAKRDASGMLSMTATTEPTRTCEPTAGVAVLEVAMVEVAMGPACVPAIRPPAARHQRPRMTRMTNTAPDTQIHVLLFINSQMCRNNKQTLQYFRNMKIT